MKNYILILKEFGEEVFKAELNFNLKNLKILKDELNYQEMLKELITSGVIDYEKTGEQKIEVKNKTYVKDILTKRKTTFNNIKELVEFLIEDGFEPELKEI